jgi:PhnB protein
MTQRVVPFIAYEDAAAAIDWLRNAFGFRESGERVTDENGVVGHAEMELDGARIMLSTPTPECRGPRRHAEECEQARRWLDNPWVIDGLFVEVDDVEAHHERAVAAGANVIRGLDEPGIGFRIYSVEDLEGHRWMFGQPTSS